MRTHAYAPARRPVTAYRNGQRVVFTDGLQKVVGKARSVPHAELLVRVAAWPDCPVELSAPEVARWVEERSRWALAAAEHRVRGTRRSS